MQKGLLVFIIYTLFYHSILLFLPVGAKFQQPTVDASTPDSTPSSGTPVVVPTSTIQPTQTIDPSTAQNIKSIQTRRISSIIGALPSPGSISSWWVPRNSSRVLTVLIYNRLSTLGSDGKWPDNEVDYTTGCAARRANWPAQAHWQRIRELTIFFWSEVIITHQL
jgi:hypothetical protein